MDAFALLYQYADAFALLTLSAIGLIIIFGMMGIINMAHGELMMAGAFGAAYSYHAGLPVAFAILAGGVVALVVGFLLGEAHHSFSLWTTSLFACGDMGHKPYSQSGRSHSTWSLSPGNTDQFRELLCLANLVFPFTECFCSEFSIVLIAVLWLLFRSTQFGVQARATMSNAEMAGALGINTTKIYVMTFGLGSFLAGISGALFSLTAPVQPTFGAAYTPIAFVVVVVAGSRNIILGLIVSALILAFVKTAFTINFNILTGYLAMLVAALLVIRATPNGISQAITQLRQFLSRNQFSRLGSPVEPSFLSMWSLLTDGWNLGRSPLFWGTFCLLVVGALVVPFFLGRYAILNLNSFLLMTSLAMGLALLWGFAGILSLGQSAFFGIGGYSYGIIAINVSGVSGQTGFALVGALATAVVFALALSWIVFYGKLRGVYVAIITLVVALLFETFLNQTAGPQWFIGSAHLGGNNGLGRFSGDIEELPSFIRRFWRLGH